MIDDETMANEFWNRIKDFIPKTWLGCDALSLNERCHPPSCPLSLLSLLLLFLFFSNSFFLKIIIIFNNNYFSLRFLRYDPGQKFEPHMDGVFMRDNGFLFGPRRSFDIAFFCLFLEGLQSFTTF
jgi:hypothetical protein